MSAIDDFSSEAIQVERSGHVGTLWLDRPDKRNEITAITKTNVPVIAANPPLAVQGARFVLDQGATVSHASKP